MILQLSPSLKNWASRIDTSSIDRALIIEKQQIINSEHLVSQVIGETEFEWDFRCLDDGFYSLVKPYLTGSSGSAALLQSTLDALDINTAVNQKAALLVEFQHYANLINDAYSCHPDFTQKNIDRRTAHALTQFRYAGQNLNNYPRYLLSKNQFNADDSIQNGLHKLVSNITILQGISRGQMIKWSYRNFTDISVAYASQHAINSVCNLILYPILLAFVLAGNNQTSIEQLRTPISYLSLAIKLGFEQQALKSGIDNISAGEQAMAKILTFPNLILAANNLPVEVPLASDQEFPEFHLQYDKAIELAKGQDQSIYTKNITDAVENFILELKVFPPLADWGENLANQLLYGQED